MSGFNHLHTIANLSITPWKKTLCRVVNRAVKKFLSNRLIINSRRLWNSHQRHKFWKAGATRDILKLRVSEMPFPGVFKRQFPMRMPCCFVRIHARLRTMLLKCSWCSTTLHGSNEQIYTSLNMRSMSFKPGKQMLYKFYLMFLIFCYQLW